MADATDISVLHKNEIGRIADCGGTSQGSGGLQ